MILHPDSPDSHKIDFLANMGHLYHKATFCRAQVKPIQLQSNWFQNEKLLSILKNSERHEKYVDQGFRHVLEGAHVRIHHLVVLKTNFEAKFYSVFEFLLKRNQFYSETINSKWINLIWKSILGNISVVKKVKSKSNFEFCVKSRAWLSRRRAVVE